MASNGNYVLLLFLEDRTCNPSSVPRVFLGVSSQLDMPRTPLEGDTASACSSWREDVAPSLQG